MKKIKPLFFLIVITIVVSSAILSGCEESEPKIQTHHYTGIVRDSYREEVNVGIAQSILVSYVMFNDGTTFRFDKGRTGEVYVFCLNHIDESVTLKYTTYGNHYDIEDFWL